MTHPFEPKTPSVFFIDSPFQAICAVAAIRQLQIDDYRMVVMLTDNKQRNSTITTFLNMQHIGYNTVNYNHFTYKWYQLMCLVKRPHNHYHRLFIGYFGAPFHHFAGCSMVADGAHVVYLDDGVATVTLLKHKQITDITYFKQKRIITLMARRRRFDLYHNLLTIYNDIDNPCYQIAALSLNVLDNKMNSTGKQQEKGIYLIGTCSQSYRHQLHISEDEFTQKTDQLMASLKAEYAGDPIVFVPHRNDEGDYARRLCEKHQEEYRPVDMTVEIELQKQECPPKVIVGFTSSALYNLKQMFPQCRVVNVLFTPGENNKAYHDFLAISTYYEKNGIEMIKI